MVLSLNGILILAFSFIVSSQEPGQPCTINMSNEEGICKIFDDCPAVITSILRRRPYTRCGSDEFSGIVCCPSDTVIPITTPAPSKVTRNSTISQQRCKEYSEAVYEYVESISLAVQPERIKTKVDKCGHKFTPFIGVEEAKPREFPHFALIGADVKYIRLGETGLLFQGNDVTPETLTIAQVFTHPEYDRSSMHNDIGLVKMDQKVRLTPSIRPACLPTTFDEPEKQAIATHIALKERMPNIMLKITLNKFTHEECNTIYSNFIHEQTQLCAGPKTPDKDNCLVIAGIDT